jgi:hypothetical protein
VDSHSGATQVFSILNILILLCLSEEPIEEGIWQAEHFEAKAVFFQGVCALGQFFEFVIT